MKKNPIATTPSLKGLELLKRSHPPLDQPVVYIANRDFNERPVAWRQRTSDCTSEKTVTSEYEFES